MGASTLQQAMPADVHSHTGLLCYSSTPAKEQFTECFVTFGLSKLMRQVAGNSVAVKIRDLSVVNHDDRLCAHSKVNEHTYTCQAAIRLSKCSIRWTLLEIRYSKTSRYCYRFVHLVCSQTSHSSVLSGRSRRLNAQVLSVWMAKRPTCTHSNVDLKSNCTPSLIMEV